MRYSIPSEYLKQFSDVYNDNDYYLIDFDSLSYGNEGVSGFVMSDEMSIRMYNWLNWLDDENKN